MELSTLGTSSPISVTETSPVWFSGAVQPASGNQQPTEPEISSVPVRSAEAEESENAAAPLLNEEEVSKAVSQANSLMGLFGSDLKFEMDFKTGILQVLIVAKEGDEDMMGNSKVIRQLPPEAVVKALERVQEAIGSLVDMKA